MDDLRSKLRDPLFNALPEREVRIVELRYAYRSVALELITGVDIREERTTGLEPATLGLGSQCSTS